MIALEILTVLLLQTTRKRRELGRELARGSLKFESVPAIRRWFSAHCRTIDTTEPAYRNVAS